MNRRSQHSVASGVDSPTERRTEQTAGAALKAADVAARQVTRRGGGVRVALRRVAALGLLMSGCASSVAPPAIAAIEDAPALPAAEEKSEFGYFSGLIVFKRFRYSESDPTVRYPAGTLYYYIDGNRWKHVDENGRVTMLYDPGTNTIHAHVRDQLRVVDAARGHGAVEIEPTAARKTILGYECRGLRLTTRESTEVSFYCPALAIDPAAYPNHHFGYWTEVLQATGGALTLWSEATRSGSDEHSVMEAVSVQRMQFTDDFWQLPGPQPGQGL